MADAGVPCRPAASCDVTRPYNVRAQGAGEHSWVVASVTVFYCRVLPRTIDSKAGSIWSHLACGGLGCGGVA